MSPSRNATALLPVWCELCGVSVPPERDLSGLTSHQGSAAHIANEAAARSWLNIEQAVHAVLPTHHRPTWRPVA